MKKVIIVNSELGIVTPHGRNDYLWSSNILSVPYAACFEPAAAMAIVSKAIPKQFSTGTRLVTIEYDSDRIHRDHDAIASFSELWDVKVVNAVITGQLNGKPVASSSTWRGNIDEVGDKVHLQAFKGWVTNNRIEHPTIYTDSERSLLAQSLRQLDMSATTLNEQILSASNAKINELINEIDLKDHTITIYAAIEKLKELVAEQQKLVSGL